MLGDDWREWVAAANLRQEWPGSAGPKGSKPPPTLTSEQAMRFWCEVVGCGYSTVLVAGRRTLAALGLGATRLDFFGRMEVAAQATVEFALPRKPDMRGELAFDGRAYLVPHPSGVSRWWNAASNRRAAKRFGRQLRRAEMARGRLDDVFANLFGMRSNETTWGCRCDIR
jgi:hypothetical protein